MITAEEARTQAYEAQRVERERIDTTAQKQLAAMIADTEQLVKRACKDGKRSTSVGISCKDEAVARALAILVAGNFEDQGFKATWDWSLDKECYCVYIKWIT